MSVFEVTSATTQAGEIEAKHAETGFDQRTRNVGSRFRVFGTRKAVGEDRPRSWQSVWFIYPRGQQMAEAPREFNFMADHASLKLRRTFNRYQAGRDFKIPTRNLSTRQSSQSWKLGNKSASQN
ncbi:MULTISPECIES: hypothetical protein [Comamonadaceae]|jgi:hypothetical protein|uniref:hypothetical protein n=1 Tax=Comamonadaceae TaxID=80864 RepID=UPI001EE197EC|nr:hypothetical protein [Acidovorax sp. JHL-9]MCM3566099.1 hypothetical protein [Hydrogenophaga intermedia]